MPPPVAPKTRPSVPSPSASSSPTSIRRTSCAPRRSCARSSVIFPISLSHRVAAEWREYERTSTAVLDAYTGPAVRGYLERLERQLDERGLSVSLHVMQSSGGVVTARSARERPVQTLLSGPGGGLDGPRCAGAPSRAAESDRRRHGRHELRRQPRRQRPPRDHDGDLPRGPASPDADREHPHHRRRWRLHRVRGGRRSPRRPAERGCRPRPRVLRTRRQPSRPSPMRTSYSAGSTRRRSPAAGCRSTPLPPDAPSPASHASFSLEPLQLDDVAAAASTGSVIAAARIVPATGARRDGCPYLAPGPHRGKPNEPAYVVAVGTAPRIGGRRSRGPRRGDDKGHSHDGLRFVNPSELRALLDRHGVQRSKALGQHFLADPNAAHRIIRYAGVEPGDDVIEVGPGSRLANARANGRDPRVLALELDQRLVPAAAGRSSATDRLRSCRATPWTSCGRRCSNDPDAGRWCPISPTTSSPSSWCAALEEAPMIGAHAA